MFKLRNIALLVGLPLVGMFAFAPPAHAQCPGGVCGPRAVVQPFRAVREAKPLRKAGHAAKHAAGRVKNAAVKSGQFVKRVVQNRPRVFGQRGC